MFQEPSGQDFFDTFRMTKARPNDFVFASGPWSLVVFAFLGALPNCLAEMVAAGGPPTSPTDVSTAS
ncbi:hypothetical protein HPB47_011875 [Ixodes persulcatus]|uniref:Uncharacterized protein n=1 Tax=Ixodes persulcatus TaxID=34615 RepID=A0AC60NV91_IXOPE|nr:hypothetical protein HPB47_011875 [Ixodes persulcatus]